MGDIEIVPRVERRRKWTDAEKAALLAEVDAEGGKVKAVARRHGISESLIYNWRSARRLATATMRSPSAVEFVPLGVLGGADTAAPERSLMAPMRSEDRLGSIEITLPNGVHVRVGEAVSEKALSRVLRAVRGSM